MFGGKRRKVSLKYAPAVSSIQNQLRFGGKVPESKVWSVSLQYRTESFNYGKVWRKGAGKRSLECAPTPSVRSVGNQ